MDVSSLHSCWIIHHGCHGICCASSLGSPSKNSQFRPWKMTIARVVSSWKDAFLREFLGFFSGLAIFVWLFKTNNNTHTSLVGHERCFAKVFLTTNNSSDVGWPYDVFEERTSWMCRTIWTWEDGPFHKCSHHHICQGFNSATSVHLWVCCNQKTPAPAPPIPQRFFSSMGPAVNVRGLLFVGKVLRNHAINKKCSAAGLVLFWILVAFCYIILYVSVIWVCALW